MKKLIAMLLMTAFLFTGAVGCGDDKAKPKPADTKDKDKGVDKGKDAKP